MIRAKLNSQSYEDYNRNVGLYSSWTKVTVKSKEPWFQDVSIEIGKWCLANGSDDRFYSLLKSFYFENPEDATAFKLRFGV